MELVSFKEFMNKMRITSAKQYTENIISRDQYSDENELLDLVEDSLLDSGKERDQSMGIWWLIMQGVLREHWLEQNKPCSCAKCKPE